MARSVWFCLTVAALTACSPIVANPTVTQTISPTATEIPATPTLEPTLEASPTPEGPFIDLSAATLEHEIDPNCVDQFPQPVEAGKSNVICFTFDNWVFGPQALAGGYEMIVGAEGWVKQNGQDVPVVIPIATANRESGQMQINGFLVQDFKDYWYEFTEAGWRDHTKLNPGDTLWVIVRMPTQELASNSTQGFGFEAVPYTEEELNEVLATGNFEILGNVLWPVIDIEGRNPQLFFSSGEN